MSIEKKSLISTLKTTKKANVAKEDLSGIGTTSAAVKSPTKMFTGKVKVATGKVKVATGKVKVATGKVKVATGKMKVATGKTKFLTVKIQ
jgi:uncharacterized protein YjbJ (UPF0337 family)